MTVTEDLIPVKAAARELSLTPSALYIALAKGRLHGTQVAGKWHLSRAALDAYRAGRWKRNKGQATGAEPPHAHARAPVPPRLPEQVAAALCGIVRVMRRADDGAPSRLLVLPRSDGSVGVYYRHPAHVSRVMFPQLTETHLLMCKALLIAAGFAVAWCEPTAEGAPCWLWVRAQ